MRCRHRIGRLGTSSRGSGRSLRWCWLRSGRRRWQRHHCLLLLASRLPNQK
jgi:hypothetical protein